MSHAKITSLLISRLHHFYFTYFTLLTLGLVTAFAGPSWTPDIQSLDGQLTLIQTLVDRYSALVSNNLQYRRSPLNPLKKVPALVQTLGTQAKGLSLEDNSRVTTYQYSGKDLKANEAAIQQVKDQLKTFLDTSPIPTFRNFEEDMEQIKDPTQLSQLFALAPFIYDPQTHVAFAGDPKSLAPKIEALDYYSLASGYKDTWPAHFWDTVEKPAAYHTANKYLQTRFIQNTVDPALTLLDETDAKVSNKQLSLEEVPALVGLYRGVFGKDCSLLSTPFHGFHKDVKIYLIRDSDRMSSEPIGYAFVIEKFIDGKRVPYVVTMNGRLNAESSQKVQAMIAADFGSEQILLPDFEENPYLVNTPDIKKGMTASEGKKTTIEMPSGWDAIDEYTKKENGTGYTNYYEGNKLRKTVLAKVVPITGIQQREVANPYVARQELGKNSLFSRAVLAAQVYEQTMLPSEIKSVINKLKVSPAQLEIAHTIITASPNAPLGASHFRNAEAQIRMTMDNVMQLDPLTRSASLARIYQEAPELLKENAWPKLAKEAWAFFLREPLLPNAPIAQRLAHIAGRAQLATILKDRQADVEKEFEALPAHLVLQTLVSQHLNSLAEKWFPKVFLPAHGNAIALAAVQAGNLQALELLKKNGYALASSRHELISTAAREGHLNVLLWLEKQLGLPTQLLNESIMEAVRGNHPELVKTLLKKKGSDIHFWEEGPLRQAIDAQNPSMIDHLVDLGADPSDIDAKFLKRKRVPEFIREHLRRSTRRRGLGPSRFANPNCNPLSRLGREY